MTLMKIKSLVYSKGYSMSQFYLEFGVSKQTFYRKIRNKDKVFLSKISELLEK